MQKKVSKKFKMNNFDDYHNLIVQSDTILLQKYLRILEINV